MEGVLNSQSDEVVIDVKKQVEDLIINDRKDEFVACIQDQLGKEKCGIRKIELCPSELLMWICSHCAVDCATALLEGESGLAVDLNVAFENGLYPLHYAAKHLSSSLTGLLLQHGAKTNSYCSDDGSKYAGMIPLSVALEKLRNKRFFHDWAPHKSIFKLIYILCLPELREPLETVKLLALDTEELLEISLCIAREGRLLELAALLMVAREKLMIKATGTDVSYIEQCITRELQLVIDQEFKLMGGSQNCPPIRICKRKKNLLLSAAVMLEVFDRAGDLLESYRLSRRIKQIPRYRLAVEVAVLLKVMGLKLKRKDTRVDDISCFLMKLGPKSAEHLKMKLQSESHFSNPAAKIVSTSSQHSPAVSCSRSQTFHTYLLPNARMDDKQSASATSRMIRTTQLVEPSFSNFTAARKLTAAREWMSFALTLQRRIRFV